MSLVQEAIIGRLGSRLSMNFRPREHKVYLSPMGRFYDQPMEMGIGLRLNGKTYILPFADLEDAILFTKVEQEFLVEGLEYRVRDDKLGLEFVCRIHAPFYPEDRQISSAPFFYLDFSIRSYIHGRKDFKPIEGEWFFSLSGSHVDNDGNITASIASKLNKDCWYNTVECPQESHFPFSENVFHGEIKVCPLNPEEKWNSNTNFSSVCFSKSFLLKNPTDILQETLIVSGYQPNIIMKAWQKDCRFQYADYFKSIDTVVEYARSRRNELLQKTALFTKTVSGASIGPASISLIACGFQNYLANSWWVSDDDGKDWFFIWEGWCSFHSTLDVEYNDSWFALLYWPELLEKQMDAWFRTIQPEGFPSHDVGILLKVDSQIYPHHMPVEESCNLLLLTYSLWRFRGNRKWEQHFAQLVKVVEYLVTTDNTGNGYPNLGVANTVDDAAASVQYAKEQTYLAVKVLAALTAFIEMAQNTASFESIGSLIEKSRSMITKIRNTMETVAWLNDHYAVCLPQSTDGLRDVWTGKEIQGDGLDGWNAYSLYTTNGLLFLLATGLKPDLNYERLLIDLCNSVEKSLTSNGCTHSSIDRSNVWLSQNMWRDQIAAYLGLDLSNMAERYWNFLEWENTQGRGGCFVDTYGWNWLSYYPRGITMIGVLAGAIGMKVNVDKMEINLSPVRYPCRIPITLLADWKEGNIPWVECRIDNGKIVWRLEGQPPLKWHINMDFGMLINQ